ncbi:MAG: AraC family transcriptional regulator [Chloroflexi bacterium]|nr:AraC family transcriptional regulator [Chloroflexota bacterium]
MKMDKVTRSERHDYVAGPRERTWGLHVVGAGRCMDVRSQLNEPGAPFHWSVGRTLPCYGLVYLTAGCGEFSLRGRRRTRVGAGDVLVLFPGVWHYYRPDVRTGWSEFWVLFEGDLAGQWAASGWLDARNPVLHPGVHGNLVELFDQLLAAARTNPPYANQVLAGLVMQLVASVLNCLQESQTHPNAETVALVRRAQQMIEEKWEQPVNLSELAASLGLKYRTFRHLFRRFTGLPPLQYQLNLRINRAKPLLEKRLTVEDVSAKTGFTDPYYFSRLFKQKTGLTPGKWHR